MSRDVQQLKASVDTLVDVCEYADLLVSTVHRLMVFVTFADARLQ